VERGGALTDRLDASCYTRSRDTVPMSILPTLFDVFFAGHRLRQDSLRLEMDLVSGCTRNHSKTGQSLSYRASLYIPSPDLTRHSTGKGVSRTLHFYLFKKSCSRNFYSMSEVYSIHFLLRPLRNLNRRHRRASHRRQSPRTLLHASDSILP
jgi:hypothetical protein